MYYLYVNTIFFWALRKVGVGLIYKYPLTEIIGGAMPPNRQ